jgi:ribosomal-protein-alanine N-acetyltransferase
MAMKLCEISFGLETGERGLGYMREALSSGLDFLIRQEGVHRIEANVSVENHRSAKLLEGVGFEKEGLRKKLWRWGDTWHDMMLYALTQEDWSGHLTENH